MSKKTKRPTQEKVLADVLERVEKLTAQRARTITLAARLFRARRDYYAVPVAPWWAFWQRTSEQARRARELYDEAWRVYQEAILAEAGLDVPFTGGAASDSTAANIDAMSAWSHNFLAPFVSRRVEWSEVTKPPRATRSGKRRKRVGQEQPQK